MKMKTSAKRYFCFLILFVCSLASISTPKVDCRRCIKTKSQWFNDQDQYDLDEEDQDKEQLVVSSDLENTKLGYQSKADPPKFSCTYNDHGEPCAFQAMCGLVPGLKLRKRRSGHAYINGGTAVEEGEFPFFAQVSFPDRSTCSAVIVSSQHVYTAAHCVFNDAGYQFRPDRVQVHVGSIKNYPLPDQNRFTYDVDKICFSPRYKHSVVEPAYYEYDVAVLRLSEKLVFDARVQPACWPYSERGPVNMGNNSECYIVGAGAQGYVNDDQGEKPLPSVQVRKTRIVRGKCDVEPHSSNFCVQDYLGKPIQEQGSTCPGDSGGPMLCRDPYKRWVVMGISGYGPYYCSAGKPSGIRKLNAGMTEVLLTSTSCAVGAADNAAGPPIEVVSCNEETDGYMCNFYRTCGAGHQVGYIINGQPTQSNEAPFLVRVVNSDSNTECVGTLVDQAHVVTSANCLKSKSQWTPLSSIKIQAGPERQVYRVISRCKAKRHSSMTIITAGNQIQLGNGVQPACWPYASRRLPAGDRQFGCVIYGLGATNQEATSLAKDVTKIVVNEVTCAGGYEPGSICFRPVDPKSSTCLDNGAPVVCRDVKHKWTLVAMVENSHPVCTPRSIIYASAIDRASDHSLSKCRD